MKKRTYIIIALILLFLVLAGSTLALGQSDILKNFGSILFSHRSNHTEPTEDVIDNKVLITQNELDQYIETFTLKESSDPRQDAIDALIRRKVLYSTALRSGIQISEEELDTYCQAIRESVQKAENISEYNSLVDAFGGEDAYWEIMRDTYRISYSIQLYWEQEREAYVEELKLDENTYDAEQRWEEKKEELTRKLIEGKEAVIE